MPFSKIWTKVKKPLFLGSLICLSIILCFISLHFTQGTAEIVFSEVLETFNALTILGTTLSIALFNYVDNISKDVSELSANDGKINKALSELSALKREIILNAGLILVLFIIEKALSGVSNSVSIENAPFEIFHWVILSLRFTVFVLAIFAVSEQIRGLIVAIEYRNVIQLGKSSQK